jgi:lipoate-protein ligase A
MYDNRSVFEIMADIKRLLDSVPSPPPTPAEMCQKLLEDFAARAEAEEARQYKLERTASKLADRIFDARWKTIK